jgi:hypothetical protein
MQELFISAAYRYVALCLMLAEANQALRKLDVAEWKPVGADEIVSHHVSPPRLRPGGSLQTSNFIFGFGAQGQLQFIQTLEPDGAGSFEARHAKWAEMKSLVGTNESYALASNWLHRLDVDVVSLEKAHPARVSQEFYFAPNPEGGNPRKVMLPRYEVKWGTNEFEPAVWVSIFGPTKEPIHIRQNDLSFSRRPRGITRNAEELLQISDGDFAGFGSVQRSNLVLKSSPVALPKVLLPGTRPARSKPASQSQPQRKLHTVEPVPATKN